MTAEGGRFLFFRKYQNTKKHRRHKKFATWIGLWLSKKGRSIRRRLIHLWASVSFSVLVLRQVFRGCTETPSKLESTPKLTNQHQKMGQ